MQDELVASLETLMAAEKLPTSFHISVETIFQPLTKRIADRHAAIGAPVIVGICGPQGSGKSTGVLAMRLLLEAQGLRVATLSLDDLYLPLEDRRRLASEVHPLFATRGPPGTHDVQLGITLLDRLRTRSPVALPSFDKAVDDRRPCAHWDDFEGPADIILFEGWCVGARPQSQDMLVDPINELERSCDADGVWRMQVNAALARYQSMFSRIDIQVLLMPPAFDVVAGWRCEQEAKLRDRMTPDRSGHSVMTDGEILRFVQHYERLTLHIMAEMPQRAEAVIELGRARELRRMILRDEQPAG